MPHRAALAGFSTLAACVGALAWIVPEGSVPPLMWLFVFIALAASALFTWQHPKAPSTPRGWLFFVSMALVGGAVFAGIEGAIRGFSSGGVFFSLGVAVLGALVALAGFVRSLLLGRENAA